MMIYLQKRVIDQNGRSPSSTENSKIRCGMTAARMVRVQIMQQASASILSQANSRPKLALSLLQ
ncbi:flagellin [Aeromonas caviae]|uniref:flagellin n=1 Tax=Aeromonas caviae TaxID=648 RepID=UPI0038D1394A